MRIKSSLVLAALVLSAPVVACGGGAEETNGGDSATPAERGLVGKPFPNGRIGLLEEFLEFLAEKKFVNHAVDPPLILRNSLSSHLLGIQPHCVERAGIA